MRSKLSENGVALIPVTCAGARGTAKVTALLDTGSNRCFATSELLNRIGARVIRNRSVLVTPHGRSHAQLWEFHLASRPGGVRAMQVCELPSLANYPEDIDIVLGCDFLSDKRFTYDGAGGVFSIEQVSGKDKAGRKTWRLGWLHRLCARIYGRRVPLKKTTADPKS